MIIHYHILQTHWQKNTFSTKLRLLAILSVLGWTY